MTDSLPNGTKYVACGFAECARPVKAKGLCATHYQRQRRTGDPGTVRRAGRPRSDDPIWQAIRIQHFDETASPRSTARYVWAWRTIEECGGDFRTALTEAIRPNGTINVAKLERAAITAVLAALAAEGPDDGYVG